jgi:hypothetical protein
MSLQGHIVELQRRHEALEKEIEKERLHRKADGAKIVELKRKKLQIKDELAKLQISETRHYPCKRPEIAPTQQAGAHSSRISLSTCAERPRVADRQTQTTSKRPGGKLFPPPSITKNPRAKGSSVRSPQIAP